MNIKVCVIFTLFFLPVYGVQGQVVQSGADSTGKTNPKAVKEIPFLEIQQKATIRKSGIIGFYRFDDKYLFEITNSLLDKDILLVSRISKAAAENYSDKDQLGYAGDLTGESVIRFSKGPDKNLFLKKQSFLYRSEDTTDNGMFRSVQSSTLQPIVASFPIISYAPDSGSVLIDVTAFLNEDNAVLFWEKNSVKTRLGLAAYQSDLSYVKSVDPFPTNLEIKTVKTYKGRADFVTYELNSSLVLLPDHIMRPRIYDPRVGYFTQAFEDFDSDPQKVRKEHYVLRWRLEPRPEDMDRYLRGKLVEPLKPIVFYIDPRTPEKWVPYLIQGVNDWQKAFEKAGFKNAIYALRAPANDSTWSMDDARHNVIVYKPSYIENASGPNIHDPRSGEILESHINWYHNIMKLLHEWYFVQAAAVDKNARNMEFDEKLMGRLIRYVCSHEIGHTLGLAHNFGASSLVPVDSLRDYKWVKKNGTSPSIMDYARFNYIAQPGDGFKPDGLFPRIGAYDEWAIEWGYRWFPPSEDRPSFFNQWIIDRLAKDKRIWYGNQAVSNDPRIQAEDLGDDPIKAGEYGIRNLKLIMDSLVGWTSTPGDHYKNLERMHEAVVRQYKRYINLAINILGGRYYTEKSVEQPGALYQYIGKEKQKRAIQFLDEQLFNTPVWISDKEIWVLTGAIGTYQLLGIQKDFLEKLLSQGMFTKFLFSENVLPGNYAFKEYLDDIGNCILKELHDTADVRVDLYRRNLQKTYLSQLMTLISGKQDGSYSSFLGTAWNDKTDLNSIVKGHLKKIYKLMNDAIGRCSNEMTLLHLQDMSSRIYGLDWFSFLLLEK